MIKNIRHIGIVVDDLEKSLHFYVDILGFKVDKEMVESSPYLDNILALKRAKVTTVKLCAPGNQMIELLYFHSHPKNTKAHSLIDIGLAHIALTVDDIENAYNTMKKAGIIFTSSPQTSPDGYAKVTFCQAPEGTYIELVEVL